MGQRVKCEEAVEGEARPKATVLDSLGVYWVLQKGSQPDPP